MIAPLKNLPGFVACVRHGVGGRAPWECPKCGSVLERAASSDGAQVEHRDPSSPPGRTIAGSSAAAPSSKPPGAARSAKAAAICDVLAEMLRGMTTAVVVREWEFAPDRAWRFDVAVPHLKLGFEADGGYRSGGHTRGAAYEDDCRKINTATLQGWRVYRIPNRWVKSDEAEALLRAAVEDGQDGRVGG